MPERAMPDFSQKSPPELVERFAALTDGIDGLERRTMFGWPAGFVGGNMVTGLFGARWHVRLSEADAPGLVAVGGAPFEPLPGRPMRGAWLLPEGVMADDDALRHWVGRAVDHGRSLPPKESRRRKR
jgi:TfoX/Sxy family transcriptional regulator of competence genes